MTTLIGPLLRSRLRSSGADPLLTYYEPSADIRVELSAVTFANWVDKTCNLLIDELLVPDRAVVSLDLARTAPGHWMTTCWEVACWQLGLLVSVGGGESADLGVTGPDPAVAELPSGTDVLACSLHPLGLGMNGSLPDGVLDYAAEVRIQPDTFPVGRVSELAPAWVDRHRHLDQSELVADLDSAPRRVLVRPGEPWETARAGIVTALVSGGSYVIVAGDVEPDRLAHIAATENVDA